MKNKSNKSIYGFLILLILFSTAFSFKLIFMHLNSLNYKVSPNLPLSSANEITIDTPENKTYTGAMSGYYPATYGFENEADGATGTGINFVDTETNQGSSYLRVISDLDGHDKVLEGYDGSTAGRNQITHDFISANQTSGTIEFYWRITTASYGANLYFYGTGASGSSGLHLGMESGYFVYRDASDFTQNIVSYSVNTWYHVRIDFECGSGGYMGLAADRWHVYINDVLYGDYVFRFGTDLDYQDSILFYNGWWAGSGYNIYYDAWGESWDPNYNIGDNLKEGLLLSYENSTNLDWVGFSLDGLTNKTIIGNTAIPLPPNGPHSIQMYGNNSLNTMYASNKRYFTISTNLNITINTPENKTYLEPMSGYFPGTYGFEAYNSGEIPDSWNDLSGTGCSAGVVDEINNHKKVIQLNDNSGNGATIETLFPNRKTGIVEWWWLSTDVNNWVNFVFYEGGTNAIHLEIGISAFRYYDTSYKTVVSSGVNNNQWYRNKVEFSVSTDTFNWFIYDSNGNLLNSVQDANFRNSVADINHLTTGTNSEQLGFQTYIDAVGFSWDSNYNIGDNLNEGLLLSYDTNTNLNWTGYSLDGSPNITITGNKVIPFPEIGIHSIILNGITSNGVLIKSEIRYFTIFSIIQDPPILPENPDLIPIILTSIGIGIIILLGITLILFRRKISSRTRSTVISRKKSQSDEASGSDQFKICPLCHTQIKKTDLFCEYCGVSLKND